MPKNHLTFLNAQAPNSVSFLRAAFEYIFIFEVAGSSTASVHFYHTARCHKHTFKRRAVAFMVTVMIILILSLDKH